MITSEEDREFEFSEIIEETAVNERTLGEVKKAIRGLNGKVPGIVRYKLYWVHKPPSIPTCQGAQTFRNQKTP